MAPYIEAVNRKWCYCQQHTLEQNLCLSTCETVWRQRTARTFIEYVQSQSNSAVTTFTENVQFFEITSTTKTAWWQCWGPVPNNAIWLSLLPFHFYQFLHQNP